MVDASIKNDGRLALHTTNDRKITFSGGQDTISL